MNQKKADQSKYSPSVYHKECGLISLVHGDDFITVGNRKNISRSDSRSKQRSSDKVRERKGWAYELDQRHADILVQGMHFSGAKGVKVPGEDEKNWEMSGPQGGGALSSTRGTSQFFGLVPAVCDEGGVQWHGGADEGTCEEIEEAQPIPH